MSQSYAKAKQAHLLESLKKKGADFPALYDLSRWFGLSPAEAVGLADAAGVALTPDEVGELREQSERAEGAAALAQGKPLYRAIALMEELVAPTPPPQGLKIKDYRR